MIFFFFSETCLCRSLCQTSPFPYSNPFSVHRFHQMELGDGSVGKTFARQGEDWRSDPQNPCKKPSWAQWSTCSGWAPEAGMGSPEQAASQMRQSDTLSPSVREGAFEGGSYTCRKLMRKTNWLVRWPNRWRNLLQKPDHLLQVLVPHKGRKGHHKTVLWPPQLIHHTHAHIIIFLFLF